jgi:hypothetical protein
MNINGIECTPAEAKKKKKKKVCACVSMVSYKKIRILKKKQNTTESPLGFAC